MSTYDRVGLRTGFQLFAGLKHRSGVYLEAGWFDAGKMDGLYYRERRLPSGTVTDLTVARRGDNAPARAILGPPRYRMSRHRAASLL